MKGEEGAKRGGKHNPNFEDHVVCQANKALSWCKSQKKNMID